MRDLPHRHESACRKLLGEKYPDLTFEFCLWGCEGTMDDLRMIIHAPREVLLRSGVAAEDHFARIPKCGISYNLGQIYRISRRKGGWAIQLRSDSELAAAIKEALRVGVPGLEQDLRLIAEIWLGHAPDAAAIEEKARLAAYWQNIHDERRARRRAQQQRPQKRASHLRMAWSNPEMDPATPARRGPMDNSNWREFPRSDLRLSRTEEVHGSTP